MHFFDQVAIVRLLNKATLRHLSLTSCHSNADLLKVYDERITSISNENVDVMLKAAFHDEHFYNYEGLNVDLKATEDSFAEYMRELQRFEHLEYLHLQAPVPSHATHVAIAATIAGK